MTFVKFDNRNWGYAGDRGTWVKEDNNKVIINKAAKGTISSAYAEELRAYCAAVGVDFDGMRCGDRVTVNK